MVAAKAAKWREEHFLGYHLLGDPNLWGTSDERTRVWPYDVDHEKEIRASYLRSGIVQGSPKPCLWFKSFGDDEPEWPDDCKSIADRGQWLLEQEEGTTVAGDHRRGALQGLRTRFPQNQIWMSVGFIPIFAADNDEAIKMLRLFAVMNNTTMGINRKMKFREMLYMIRDDLTSTYKRLNHKRPPRSRYERWTCPPGRMKQQRTMWMMEYDVKVGKLGLLVGIASLCTAAWELLKKLIEANTSNVKAKPVTSITNLHHLFNMSGRDQVDALKKVIQHEHGDVKMLAELCKNKKAEVVIRKHVLNTTSAARWDQVVERFGDLFDDTWIKRWVPAVRRVKKQKLSKPFMQEVRTKLRSFRKSRQERQVLFVCVVSNP